jgi:hypothetical protein
MVRHVPLETPQGTQGVKVTLLRLLPREEKSVADGMKISTIHAIKDME